MTTISPPADGPYAAPTPRPTRPSPEPVRLFSPLRLLGAMAQLAVVGVAWPFAFTVLAGMLASGIGLTFVFGVGLPILIAFVYALFGLGWLETARVEGLYGFGLAPRTLRRSGRRGFGGFVRTLWLQLSDGGVWRAVASAAVSTVLGWMTLTQISILASGTAMSFASALHVGAAVPLRGTGFVIDPGWTAVAGPAAALLAAAALVGTAALHGVLVRAILVPSREAQLAEQARTWQEQRAGAVHAADVERTRIERDLHDGVQPRLVALGMTLGMAQQKIDADPDAARRLIAEAHASTKAAITELRQLARGIHTSVLDDRGLDAALSALAARSPVPIVLDARISRRCSPQAEAAVYFVIAESLTNAAKHSRAAQCRVLVRQREAGLLWARVEDDGVGGASVVPGGGLDGLSNRVLAVGGTFRLDSPAGGPTSVEVSVPCAF